MWYIQYFSHKKGISNNLFSSSNVHTNTDQETLAVWLLQKLRWKKKQYLFSFSLKISNVLKQGMSQEIFENTV